MQSIALWDLHCSPGFILTPISHFLSSICVDKPHQHSQLLQHGIQLHLQPHSPACNNLCRQRQIRESVAPPPYFPAPRSKPSQMKSSSNSDGTAMSGEHGFASISLYLPTHASPSIGYVNLFLLIPTSLPQSPQRPRATRPTYTPLVPRRQPLFSPHLSSHDTGSEMGLITARPS